MFPGSVVAEQEPSFITLGANLPAQIHIPISASQVRHDPPLPLLRPVTTLPFVISTEAQRSGVICGLPAP